MPDNTTEDRVVYTGYTPQEGYWTAKFGATAPGLYLVEHAMDKVVNHGQPVRYRNIWIRKLKGYDQP